MAFGSSSFQTLIDEYYIGLYRYAYRLSGSSSDAEDLTQETFRKALARIGQLRNPERAKSWLYRILRNAYLHRIRGEKRSRVVPLDGVAEIPNRDERPPAAIDPADLQAALNDLDESFRTPLILYYFEEFSYKEIADQLDLPIGTVMSRLARAKGYLRGKLARFDVT
ncbi:MAG: RNA polymerase sigma factor [Gemmataceae bacterium]